MVLPKAAQSLPPGCERGWYGAVGMFCFYFHCFTSQTAENVSSCFGLLKYKMFPISHVGLDAHSIIAKDTC